ncbi:MAG: AMP-binding protein [Pseudolabrys sp.]|nr:AMP-binding protein [Pseudolabrys sp.]MDP2294999.1 AMP-binding protein [Pseudolabrys sp.]
MIIEPALLRPRLDNMKRLGFWKGRTVLDDLDRNLVNSPDRTAFIGHNATLGTRVALTSRELDERVNAIASLLVSLGVCKGDVVAYQLPNWWQFVVIHLAALRIGAITNPIMPIFRQRELKFMLNHGEAKVVFIPKVYRGFDYEEMFAGMAADLPTVEQVIVIDGAGSNGFDTMVSPFAGKPLPADAQAGRAGPDDVIEILYTSGTTGEPKGVMHTSNTIISNLDPYAERLGLGKDDVVLMASPMAHQTGFMYGLMMPISLNCTGVLQDVWVPDKAAEIIESEGVTFTMASTPFLTDLTNIAEKKPAAFKSLKIFVAAGAPIPRALARRASEHLGAKIVSAWGMTENGAVTVTRPEDPPEKVFETDGVCLRGMETRVIGGDDRPVAPGQEGRLQVRGCSNFVGYLKRPQWNATDEDGWFETGDLARMDSEGYVRITGRAKDIIIRGGENIPVVEIEGLVYQHPSVAEVAIVGMPDERMGERACAFVVAKPNSSGALSLDDISNFLLGRNISKTYLPERLEVVAELPKTPSGKVQKFRLREIAKSLNADR